MAKVPEIITGRFIEAIEKGGILPWQKPWKSLAYCNATNKRCYRGINVLMLAVCGNDNEYLTYNQAKQAGGNIREGAKGIPITFYAKMEKKGQESMPVSERDSFFFLRYYTVFGLNDSEGTNIQRRELPLKNFTPIEMAERIAANCKCPIEHGGNRACYSPHAHKINMPLRESFASVEKYYLTLFHEITHSLEKTMTGEIRANSRGDEPYAKEELVAELGANFFASYCGIDSTGLFDHSAAYLQNWLEALKNDSKLLISAASQAQKRFDYLRDIIAPAPIDPKE